MSVRRGSYGQDHDCTVCGDLAEPSTTLCYRCRLKEVGEEVDEMSRLAASAKDNELCRLRAELEKARSHIIELDERWDKLKTEIVNQRNIEEDDKRWYGLDLAFTIMNEIDEDIKTDKNGYTTWGDNSICGGCKKEGGLTMKHNSQDTTLCVECLESRGLPCPPENPGWPVLGRRW